MTVLADIVRFLSVANRIVLELCRYAAISLTIGIAVIVAAGVFWRYVLNDSLTWSEELAKFFMVWLVFFGAPIALRVGDHVAIHIFPDALPERLRSILMVFISLLVVWFCYVLTIESSLFAWNARTQVLIAIGDFSMLWIFASIPFGAAVMFSVSIQQTLEHLQNAIRPGTAKIDGFQEQYGAILRDIG